MIAVVNLNAPADATVPPEEALEEDDRGALPWLGMAGLTSSAAFAVWTSLTCFVC